MSLFCRTQMKIFCRKFVTRLFWGTIDFHSRNIKYTMEINGAPELLCFPHSSEYLPLCLVEQRHSYRFGTTWGWVNDDRIFIFGWTIPLRPLNRKWDNFCLIYFKTLVMFLRICSIHPSIHPSIYLSIYLFTFQFNGNLLICFLFMLVTLHDLHVYFVGKSFSNE